MVDIHVERHVSWFTETNSGDRKTAVHVRRSRATHIRGGYTYTRRRARRSGNRQQLRDRPNAGPGRLFGGPREQTSEIVFMPVSISGPRSAVRPADRPGCRTRTGGIDLCPLLTHPGRASCGGHAPRRQPVRPRCASSVASESQSRLGQPSRPTARRASRVARDRGPAGPTTVRPNRRTGDAMRRGHPRALGVQFTALERETPFGRALPRSHPARPFPRARSRARRLDVSRAAASSSRSGCRRIACNRPGKERRQRLTGGLARASILRWWPRPPTHPVGSRPAVPAGAVGADVVLSSGDPST